MEIKGWTDLLQSPNFHNLKKSVIQVSVMRVGSDTFRDPIFQKELQN